MISIWDIKPYHLGTVQQVTDGVNIWVGEVLDFCEELGYAWRNGQVVEQRSREVFVGEERHFASKEDKVVEGI